MMSVQFAILASGSRGNACLIKAGGSGLLVDFGLGPRTLANRLASVGSGWDDIRAVLLTHTHGDHIDSYTFGHFLSRKIPVYVHEGHRRQLGQFSGYPELLAEGLVRDFDGCPFLAPGGFRVEPIELSHDGGPTYGFRVEARPERKGRTVAVGYIADTGIWTNAVADALVDVDVLGVEFNHDAELQRQSGRSYHLVERNLGKRGHLSNDQGADLVKEVLERSARGSLRHVVLLHLSQECNMPELAVQTAVDAIRSASARVVVHAAEQAVASPNILVTPRKRAAQPRQAPADLPF